ncbi:MAG: LysM domain-containing protein [Rickettsiales bacterium]
MSLVDSKELASPQELERRAQEAQNSAGFFDTNRDALIANVQAEIENGSDLGKSLERHAHDIGIDPSNTQALASAVVDSWKQSATMDKDWGALRDARDMLSGNTNYGDMNINTALKERGMQLYEASQDPGELRLTAEQQAEMRADLEKGRAPAEVTPAEQAHINEVAAATYAQIHQSGLNPANFVHETDANRDMIQNTALAMSHLDPQKYPYFEKLGFPGEQVQNDIIAFKKEHHLVREGQPVTGEIDAAFLQELKSEIAKTEQAPAYTPGLNALARIDGVPGFTPPGASYPVHELSQAERDTLDAEVKEEVAKIRAEHGHSQNRHSDAAPTAHDAIASERAQFEKGRSNGDIPMSTAAILASEQAAFQQAQANGEIPMSTAAVILQEQMAQDRDGIAAARQGLAQSGYDPVSRIDELAGKLAGEVSPQQPTPPASGTNIWADDAPAAPSQSPAGPSQTAQSMTIEEGDTLSKIAAQNLRDHGKAVTAAAVEHEVERLADLNDIKDENRIYAGATLKMDNAPATATAQANPPASPSPSQIAADEPPPTPEELQQAQDDKRNKFIGRAAEVASMFGLPGGLISAIADLTPPIERNMHPSQQQAVHVADGTNVVPMQVPGRSPSREASMTV